jgi:hypothetical protein
MPNPEIQTRLLTLNVKLTANTLLELQAALEAVHAAAKSGNLDWGAVDLTARLTFTGDMNAGQDFNPLEDLQDTQNRPWGTGLQLNFVRRGES